MRRLYFFFLLFLIFLPPPVLLTTLHAETFPPGKIDTSLSSTVDKGPEELIYEVSWSGGVKIGKLHMKIEQTSDSADAYAIRVRVKDSGLFHFFYPVDDLFITVIRKMDRLPVSYMAQQKEGRDYQATRRTIYNQNTGHIYYRKNDQPEAFFLVNGKVHNEFSSFFFTRFLQLVPGRPVLVATFADGKRHEVVVYPGKRSRLKNTILGDVNVLTVSPLMEFKGLYNKDGDTVIWFTDDLCRIPLKINSKILIGSLTAELVSYTNPNCSDQSLFHQQHTENIEKSSPLELAD